MLKRSLALCYTALAAIAACGDAVAPPQPDLRPAQFCRRIDGLYAAFGRPFGTIDDVREGMSPLLPGGFAGAVQDTTMLVWPNDSAAMREAASWGRRCFASAQFPWEHALLPALYFVQFSWAQLTDYKWRSYAVSRHHEYLVDIDERQNLLRIGVLTEAARQLVLEDLSRASIPLSAVVVVIVPPVVALVPPSARIFEPLVPAQPPDNARTCQRAAAGNEILSSRSNFDKSPAMAEESQAPYSLLCSACYTPCAGADAHAVPRWYPEGRRIFTAYRCNNCWLPVLAELRSAMMSGEAEVDASF